MISEVVRDIRINWKISDDKRDEGLTTPEDIIRFDNISYGSYGDANLLDIYHQKFVTSAVHDFILKNAQPMYEKLQSLGIDSEVHIYGSKEKEEVGHVFHVNCRLPEADQCNDEECAFFNRYVV